MLLVGAEPLLQREAWEGLLAQVVGANPPPMTISEFDGPSAAMADLLDEVRSPSFLAPVKLVRVRDADALLKRENNREALARYLEAPSSTGVLVLQLASEAKTTRLYKAVDKMGGVVACTPAGKGFDAAGWAMDRARKLLGKRLATDAADALVDAVGADITLLANELDKLALFVEPKAEIELEDVSALVGRNRTETIFQIADSLAARRPDAALTHWRRLVENERDAPFRAVGGLASAVRRLLIARRLLDSGLPEMAIIQQSGAWGLRGKLRAVLGPLTSPRLERMLADLLQIDRQSKSGMGEIERDIELFLVRHG